MVGRGIKVAAGVLDGVAVDVASIVGVTVDVVVAGPRGLTVCVGVTEGRIAALVAADVAVTIDIVLELPAVSG